MIEHRAAGAFYDFESAQLLPVLISTFNKKTPLLARRSRIASAGFIGLKAKTACAFIGSIPYKGGQSEHSGQKYSESEPFHPSYPARKDKSLLV